MMHDPPPDYRPKLDHQLKPSDLCRVQLPPLAHQPHAGPYLENGDLTLLPEALRKIWQSEMQNVIKRRSFQRMSIF